MMGSCCCTRTKEITQEDIDFLLRHTRYDEEDIRDLLHS